LPEKLVGYEAVVYLVPSQLRFQSILVHSPPAALQSGAEMCFGAVRIFAPFLSFFIMAIQTSLSSEKTDFKLW